MRLRVRLALAFVLLSALPLAGLAFYSYTSSSTALRRAAEAEAALMARELEVRVESVAAGVDERVRAFARLPIDSWVGDGAETGATERQVLSDLAGALPFIEGFEFVPRAPEPPVAPVAAPSAAAPPKPAAPARSWSASFVFGRSGEQKLNPEQQEAMRAELAKVRADVLRAVADTARIRELSSAQRQVLVEHQKRTLESVQASERELAKLVATSVDAPVDGASAPPAAVWTPATPAVEPVAPVPAVAAAPARAAGAPFPTDVSCSVTDGAHVVGELKARIKAKDLLKAVLAQADRGQGEIPFALDDAHTLFVAQAEDRDKLAALPAIAMLKQGAPEPPRGARGDDWVVVTRRDPSTGFRFGIAKPVSAAMAELKQATARNFGFGLALIGIALVGMVPVSSGLLKSVRTLEAGATRIAAGDLSTRVPIRSRDEFGRLAGTFNRMAEQLSENQERLLREEHLRKEREIERALLAAENERRGRELEEARQFQLSLLPKQLPALAGFELAVSMTTATEVGGDYYDFLPGDKGELVLAVGDATGHGPAAGTMVTAVKSLFTAEAAGRPPASFLAHATQVLHRMDLHRMAMALAVARIEGARVTLSSAGMPPVLHYRAAEGRVDEIALAGTPLGTRASFPYREATVELAPADCLLLLSDGFPELPDAAGEPLGYERARELFQAAAAGPAEQVVARLRAAALDWTGGAPPCDDVTFLVLRARDLA